MSNKITSSAEEYYVVTGMYVPKDADLYDDGNRAIPFNNIKRLSLDLCWNYINQVTNGNHGAILSLKIKKVIETKVQEVVYIK